MNEYKLVVEVRGLEQLDRTMGATVVDAALADLSPLVNELTARVLGLADRYDAVAASRRGCWSFSFALGAKGSAMQAEAAARLDSIGAAARELANKSSVEIFGPASAGMASLTTVCVAHSSTLDMESEMQAAAKLSLDTGARAAVQEIIDRKLLRTVVQPIVMLPEGRVVGVEALSRGPAGSAYERADHLFGAAARNGLTEALEMTCAAQAIPYWKQLPGSVWMSVNASAATIGGLSGLMSEDPMACSRMILELTEHLPLGKIDELRPTLDGLRSKGTRIALDDTGCGYADLDVAGVIEADIVKLCITVIGRLEEHPQVRVALAEAVKLAHAQGALILAEGVETEGQASILRDLGVDLAQGWLYGRPFPASELGTWTAGMVASEAARAAVQ
ncbi:MAG TPA: EAL domain-containing protein [Granulicella sp.]|nr:EAL domain-containing protein [Granulicella sp.]